MAFYNYQGVNCEGIFTKATDNMAQRDTADNAAVPSSCFNSIMNICLFPVQEEENLKWIADSVGRSVLRVSGKMESLDWIRMNFEIGK